MSNEQQKSGLSEFEWFGLISGVIGLIADIYSLSSIFRQSQSLQANTPYSMSAQLWVVLFLSLIYTIFIISFYSRRFFCLKNRVEGSHLTEEEYKRIEKGAFAITCIVGIPLFFSYVVIGSLALSRAALGGKSDLSSDLYAATVVGLFIGAGASTLIFPINNAAKSSYVAFDPNYEVPDL